jgi:hypothetical protein
LAKAFLPVLHRGSFPNVTPYRKLWFGRFTVLRVVGIQPIRDSEPNDPSPHRAIGANVVLLIIASINLRIYK